MTQTERVWKSRNEAEWRTFLDRYWNYVKPSHLEIEKEFNSLNSDIVKKMDSSQWYEFLLKKYFYWKYTAPNRYKTTTNQLKKYVETDGGLSDLFQIKEAIFNFEKNNILQELKITSQIKDLGMAGASGLLAVLFPSYFATVDQFAVKALNDVSDLPERSQVVVMNPDNIKGKDAVILITIMKQKAIALNTEFKTIFWTPRKVDMVLWTVGR